MDDARAEAIRYADAITGVDRDDDDEREDDDAEDDDQDDSDEAAAGDDDRRTSDDQREGHGSRDDDDDRGDGQLAEDEEVRRAIEDGDVHDDSDPAVAGSVTGDLTAVDATTPPGALAGDDVSFSAASAGAPEAYESWMRHRRPSRWGRLDLGVQWRRRWSEPMQAMPRRYDEVLLVATWRR